MDTVNDTQGQVARAELMMVQERMGSLRERIDDLGEQLLTCPPVQGSDLLRKKRDASDELE